MRNLLATVPRQAQGAVAAIVRTIFAQPDHASALAQLHRVADGLRARFPDAAELLEEACEDVLAHLHFPEEHRRRLTSLCMLASGFMEWRRGRCAVGISLERVQC